MITAISTGEPIQHILVQGTVTLPARPIVEEGRVQAWTIWLRLLQGDGNCPPLDARLICWKPETVKVARAANFGDELLVAGDGLTVFTCMPDSEAPDDLPAPVEGVRLVVSLITASAAQAEGRSTDDRLVVGEAVRDEGGRIIGVTGFGAV